MCIPGLHLLLGIYNRLWSLLGDACNELDLMLAYSSLDNISSNGTYSQYVSLVKRRLQLQYEVSDQQNYLFVMNEMVTFASISLPDAEHDVLKELHKDIDASNVSLSNKVNRTCLNYNKLDVSMFYRLQI